MYENLFMKFTFFRSLIDKRKKKKAKFSHISFRAEGEKKNEKKNRGIKAESERGKKSISSIISWVVFIDFFRIHSASTTSSHSLFF